MKTIQGKDVLISGASIAGLSTAWWMHHLGYEVTVVERAPELRVKGAAIDFKGDTIEVVKRMGLYDKLKEHRIHCDRIEFVNEAGESQYSVDLPDGELEDIEIERPAFFKLLYDELRSKVNFLFSDSITALIETQESMEVQFSSGQNRCFHLVIGCDGVHSQVRRLWFGEESEYARFMKGYGSITILDKLLIKQRTAQIYRTPGKSIYLNAYNGKTDVILNFYSEQEIKFEVRDRTQQREMINELFKGLGWRSDEILEEIRQSDNFYFIDYYQVEMPSWTKGRVALVGDAAYCVTPAAGRGASLAMSGAAVLADALQNHQGDHEQAFLDYNKLYKPFTESVQADARQTLDTVFLPQTDEDVQKDPEKPKFA